MKLTAVGILMLTQLFPIQQNPLEITYVPPAPTIPCDGTGNVAQVIVTGGNGNVITLSLTGDTADFGLDSATLPAHVIVAGLHCTGAEPLTDHVSVTANQD